MSILKLSLRIWVQTILFNALITGIGTLLMGQIFGFIVIFILPVLGIVFAIPLLPLTNALIRFSVQLPYSPPARIVWLGFCLSVLIVLFYNLFSFGFMILFGEGCLIFLILAAHTALVLALYFAGGFLKQLYAEQDTQTPPHGNSE